MAKSDVSAAIDSVSLEALVSRAVPTGRKLPPVEMWDPASDTDIGMEIRSDGTWFHGGTPITRQPLIRLFSTVLRKDADGRTYLVTPVEKVVVHVADAPFIGVEMSVTQREAEQVLTFRTNVGDVVEAGPDHPLRFETSGGDKALKPYLHVRGRLEALISRAVAYDLAQLGQPERVDGVDTYCIRSGGAVFPIMAIQQLEAQSR